MNDDMADMADNNTMNDAMDDPVEVPYRPWWLPITAAAIGLCVGAIAMTATLVVMFDWFQERRESDEVLDCSRRWAAMVDEAEHEAENADNRLTVLVARESITPSDPSFNIYERIGAAIDEIDETAGAAEAVLQGRREWLEAGSPLPCPVP